MTIVEKHSAADKEEKHLALRGWMQFTTAKNAKEFIKHWSKVIQTRLATGEVPFLVSVEHSVRSLDDGNSVQVSLQGVRSYRVMPDLRLTQPCYSYASVNR